MINRPKCNAESSIRQLCCSCAADGDDVRSRCQRATVQQALLLSSPSTEPFVLTASDGVGGGGESTGGGEMTRHARGQATSLSVARRRNVRRTATATAAGADVRSRYDDNSDRVTYWQLYNVPCNRTMWLSAAYSVYSKRTVFQRTKPLR